jgi:hypothetical protein
MSRPRGFHAHGDSDFGTKYVRLAAAVFGRGSVLMHTIAMNNVLYTAMRENEMNLSHTTITTTFFPLLPGHGGVKRAPRT